MPDILTNPESEDYKNSAEYWKERFIEASKDTARLDFLEQKSRRVAGARCVIEPITREAIDDAMEKSK